MSALAASGQVQLAIGRHISTSPGRSLTRFSRSLASTSLSFLYHSLSWGSDVMAEINEVPSHQVGFVRECAVLAPVTQAMPPYFKLHGTHGTVSMKPPAKVTSAWWT